jgi:hypothetical protein
VEEYITPNIANPNEIEYFFLNKKRGAPLNEHVADAIYIEALSKTRPIEPSI